MIDLLHHFSAAPKNIIEGAYRINSGEQIGPADIYLIEKKVLQTAGGEHIGTLHKEVLNFTDGEIWIIFPDQKQITRFFRPNSNSNTILLTEQCDQLCIMCSQPPKQKDYLHFKLYLDAIKLIDRPCTIGISGGEPTLYLTEMLDFIATARQYNNWVEFHILTNAQHFKKHHLEALSEVSEYVVWAVPIYSNIPEEHDMIVGKIGAFKNLQNNLVFLAMSSSRIEIRTVILQSNYFSIIGLAKYLTTLLPWIDAWSIMQLEPKGYAQIDWETKFCDTSQDFSMIQSAIEIFVAKEMTVSLYNFPYCTVPKSYRRFVTKSISDWKQKYINECMNCKKKKLCGGFFEWYKSETGYAVIGLER